MTVSAQPSSVPAPDDTDHAADPGIQRQAIQLEARVAGRLDEERLRSAVRDGACGHATAQAVELPTDDTGQGEPRQPGVGSDIDALEVVDCPDDAALGAQRAALYSSGAAHPESAPLRVCLARHPEGDVVMLSADDAVFDGFGSLRVLQSIAGAYGGATVPEPGDVTPTGTVEGQVAPEPPWRQRRPWRTLLAKAIDLSARSARLGTDQPSGDDGCGFHHLRLPVPDPHLGVTVTDQLAAALNMAVDGWNAEHGVSFRRIGVLIPVDRRPAAGGNAAAGKDTLGLRVSTRAVDRTTPQRVLDAVVSQSGEVDHPDVERRLSPVAGRTGTHFNETALLCDLGWVAVPPNFGPGAGTAAELWFSCPPRFPCGLALCGVRLGDALHLVFRYRRTLWGPDAAARFAERFRVELHLLIRETAS